METRAMGRFAFAFLILFLITTTQGEESDRKDKGKRSLLEKSYTPAVWSPATYQNAWKQWGLKEKPEPRDYDRLFQERYGLHPAPYPNNSYPMGIREASFALTGKKGLANDCMVCHGGSIAGKSYVGLGNTSLDLQLLFDELNATDGKQVLRSSFHFCNVRGTNEAGALAVFLLGFREPDLKVRFFQLDLDVIDDLCEDVPAWWILRKKKTMYYNGGADTRSVRSLMQFMMSPLNGPGVFKDSEADFADIRDYLLSIQPPAYPLPIDKTLAREGEKLFVENCGRCHGSYGDRPTYPNKIIPLDEIGTDRHRYDGIGSRFTKYYDKSWFAQGGSATTPNGYPAIESKGYQAPPLDGIWATAPYLHNGSIPTLYHLLNSKSRPSLYTRSFRTGLEDYDSRNLGWKIRELPLNLDEKQMSPMEKRKIYDTRKPGRGNKGHTYGDHLEDKERYAIIEYLKTI